MKCAVRAMYGISASKPAAQIDFHSHPGIDHRGYGSGFAVRCGLESLPEGGLVSSLQSGIRLGAGPPGAAAALRLKMPMCSIFRGHPHFLAYGG